MNKHQRILELSLNGEENINVEFKAKYDFPSDKSEFLRDIISMCNPAEQPNAEDIAYLIIGAKGGRLLDTSDLNLDESDIRSTLHAYISPQVNFCFYLVRHDKGNLIGIEIVRTADLYVIQKRHVSKKKKRVQGVEEEYDDIVSPGECWIREGTRKSQLTGSQIGAYQHRLFKKTNDRTLLPVYERISYLEETVKALRESQPDIRLMFSNGQDTLPVKISTDFREKQQWLNEQVAVLKSRHPKIEPVKPEADDRRNFDFINSFSESKIAQYNMALGEYYEKLPAYADKRYEYVSKKRATALVVLRLINSGNSPATDIDVSLEIPPQCATCYELRPAKFLKAEAPDAPMPPSYPKADIYSLVSHLVDIRGPIRPNYEIQLSPRRSKESNRSTKISKSRLLCKIKKLKHGHEMLIRFCLILTSPSFQCVLQYQITAENMREGRKGILTVNNELVRI